MCRLPSAAPHAIHAVPHGFRHAGSAVRQTRIIGGAWSAWDQGGLALSGGVLAASWSFNRFFSANLSAAIRFEKVARTGPLLSPSFTAKNAPSWVTTYVAITPIWHRSLLNTVPSRWIEDKISFSGAPPRSEHREQTLDGLRKAGWQVGCYQPNTF